MTSLTAPAAAPPRRPRRAATVYLAVMAALVLVWFAAAWRWHDSWEDGATRANGLLLPPILLLLVALAAQSWIRWRRRPVAFDVHDGAFVAPPADLLSAATTALLLTGGAVLAGAFLWPLSAAPSGWPAAAGRIVAAALLITSLVRLGTHGRGNGRIMLRPEGLRITHTVGSRDVPWEAVSAGPTRSGTFIEPALRIGRPELLRSTGLLRHPAKVYLPASETWILREFLADAINYYLATPGARHTIGTEDGYTHLRRVLWAG